MLKTSLFSHDFVQKILRESEEDDTIEVKDVVTEPATGKGDNYMSDMIRASVEYTRNKSGCKVTENKFFIIKISPTIEGPHKDVVQNVGVFETEINMMSDTLVKMNEMLTDDDCRLSARVLHTEIGDPSMLVLEDLKQLGYRMADRQAGLDLKHCILVMRGLANFHATSVALCEKDPQLKTLYKRGMCSEDYPEKWKRHFEIGVETLAKEIDNWEELGSSRHRYSKKLLKLSKGCYEKARECMIPKDDDFNVINHGDAWVNNILFRYDNEGNVIGHIFVDFQLSIWTSPALDITYFISTSIPDEVNRHHHDNLLKEYLNTLKSTMNRLGCKTIQPTMETLKKSLKEREVYSVLMSCTILPIVLADKTDVKDPNEMALQGEDFFNPFYKGQIFRKILMSRIPVWDASGVLDV